MRSCLVGGRILVFVVFLMSFCLMFVGMLSGLKCLLDNGFWLLVLVLVVIRLLVDMICLRVE